MKRFALLFTIMVTFACTAAHAQFTQSELVSEWQRAKNYTKAYLDAMPADGYSFKPTPEIRSFAQQMLHLADGNYFMVSTAAGIASPMDEKSVEKEVSPTKEATIKAVLDSYDFVINTLKIMTPAQLQQSVSLEGHTVTRFGGFGKAFEHQTHHRGQTTIYLRLKGVTPPGEMLF
ncbi:DinB family protein [Mucilaginibacter sp. X4EP1]|uniref:DinB family protein n=1 Tax=Mucilaginibacter sp. X4EP1 TaxID=2723092 RepID=UPI0021670C0C|nr:DinB family protein [Mucilaginibacter sp. X4EP1]MCS3815708.1 putative damage-inducible protein DinB [Mucilaginibacter sp. X4EP1]